jgi:exodeoxyribonuclease VII large subunit
MFQEQEKSRRIYSLIDVANSIKAVFAKNYTSSYWIKAEISKLNLYPKSGHCFPDLVEKKDGEIKAQMRAIIWANDFAVISEKFLNVTREKLSDGLNILFLARVEFSPTYGLSLNITDIEPYFTLGEMAKEKTATIEKLKKEGLFYNNINLPFPLLPKKIAVISIETSKGYSDFKTIINNNPKKYQYEITLFPSLLQGDKAVESINRQLEAIRKSKNNFDVVVIIRGGGADVGLTCFDNYLLARNIADFPLPVISGIGHSTNETVVEMVSNQNKITPTDVAYFFLKCYDNIFDLLNNFENEIFDIAENIISLESHRLIEAVQQYKTLSMNLLKNAEYKFETLSNSSNKTIRDFISNKKQEFNNLTEKITLRPRQIVEGQKIMLENKISFIQLFNKQYLKNNSNKLNILLSKTELLDPKNVLKRGYSITKFKGKVLKDPKGVNENDIIETELFLGTIKSIVGKAK